MSTYDFQPYEPIDQMRVLKFLALNPDHDFTNRELAEAMDHEYLAVSRMVGRLVHRKYAGSSDTQGRYQITQAGLDFLASGQSIKSGAIKGRQQNPRDAKADSLRSRVWRTIARLRKFSVSQVVQIAAKESDKNPVEATRRYINNLSRAEFIKELPRRHKDAMSAPSSNGEKVYWLLESSGRLPPRVRRAPDGTPGMFDPNTNTYHPFAAPEEKAA